MCIRDRFGCVLQTGTAELLSFPERKEVNTQDWREENGSEYDLQLPVFKDKEVTLNCAITVSYTHLDVYKRQH